jgi:hypothetical protein
MCHSPEISTVDIEAAGNASLLRQGQSASQQGSHAPFSMPDSPKPLRRALGEIAHGVGVVETCLLPITRESLALGDRNFVIPVRSGDRDIVRRSGSFRVGALRLYCRTLICRKPCRGGRLIYFCLLVGCVGTRLREIALHRRR